MIKFENRASQMAANIIVAELSIFPNVFTRIEQQPDGTVLTQSRSGNRYHLRWSIEHQCIETVNIELQTLEIAA